MSDTATYPAAPVITGFIGDMQPDRMMLTITTNEPVKSIQVIVGTSDTMTPSGYEIEPFLGGPMWMSAPHPDDPLRHDFDMDILIQNTTAGFVSITLVKDTGLPVRGGIAEDIMVTYRRDGSVVYQGLSGPATHDLNLPQYDQIV